MVCLVKHVIALKEVIIVQSPTSAASWQSCSFARKQYVTVVDSLIVSNPVVQPSVAGRYIRGDHFHDHQFPLVMNGNYHDLFWQDLLMDNLCT